VYPKEGNCKCYVYFGEVGDEDKLLINFHKIPTKNYLEIVKGIEFPE